MMTTNRQDTRPASRPGDSVTVQPTPVTTSGANPSGVNGVAVYDQGPDVKTDPSMRSSASMANDPTPVETRSSGAMIGWIIGIVVLLVLAYFLLQMVF